MGTMKKMINIWSQDNVGELCIPPESFLLKEYSIIQDSIKSFLLVFYKGNGNKVHIKLVENFDYIFFFWKSLQIICYLNQNNLQAIKLKYSSINPVSKECIFFSTLTSYQIDLLASSGLEEQRKLHIFELWVGRFLKEILHQV